MPFVVRTLAVAVAILLLSAPPCQGQGRSGAIQLRPGDFVRLQVRDEPGLKGDFQVDESGEVLLPMLGLVRVAGRDFDEVRREVATRFDRELARRELQLVPLLRIAVLGEVRQPSLYPVDPTYTLMDVLALAGGLAPTADPRRVSLVRDGETISLSLQPGAPALEGGLRSGDQLLVGRRSWLRENLSTVVTTAASLTVAIVTTLLLR